MPSARRAGSIYRRCECRDVDGKLLGTSCPKLKKKSHGSISFVEELPPDAEGKRRTFPAHRVRQRHYGPGRPLPPGRPTPVSPVMTQTTNAAWATCSPT
ncbi:hypothetical protein SALBM135S_02768 [Streptomyces alboniger]